jgi:hypothetical protein
LATIATHFSPVPTALLRDPTISLQAKALYAVIRSYADFGKAGGAHPSQATLCKVAGISMSHLRRCREELRKAKWLRWTLLTAPSGDVRRTDYTCHDVAGESLRPRLEVPPPVEGGVPPPAPTNREPYYRETYTEKSQKAFSRKPQRVMPKTYTYTPGVSGPEL